MSAYAFILCAYISTSLFCVHAGCVLHNILILFLGYIEARNCLDHRFIEELMYHYSYAVYSFPNLLLFISIMKVWKWMGSKWK
jgi:hypothetical protein